MAGLMFKETVTITDVNKYQQGTKPDGTSYKFTEIKYIVKDGSEKGTKIFENQKDAFSAANNLKTGDKVTLNKKKNNAGYYSVMSITEPSSFTSNTSERSGTKTTRDTSTDYFGV